MVQPKRLVTITKGTQVYHPEIEITITGESTFYYKANIVFKSEIVGKCKILKTLFANTNKGFKFKDPDGRVSINKDRIAKGDVLIAIDPCNMERVGPTLTIGKEYTVISVNEKEFCVIDDDKEEHYFLISEVGIYFNV